MVQLRWHVSCRMACSRVPDVNSSVKNVAPKPEHVAKPLRLVPDPLRVPRSVGQSDRGERQWLSMRASQVKTDWWRLVGNEGWIQRSRYMGAKATLIPYESPPVRKFEIRASPAKRVSVWKQLWEVMGKFLAPATVDRGIRNVVVLGFPGSHPRTPTSNDAAMQRGPQGPQGVL